MHDPTAGELLESARRTMPTGGKVSPADGPGVAVLLERAGETRRVTAGSARDDDVMAATWANMAAVQMRNGGAR